VTCSMGSTMRLHWQGKDGLALKAARGEAVAADLARQCPLLTPQQLYRLTEHYDNDWAVGERAAALTVLCPPLLRKCTLRWVMILHDDRADAIGSRAPASSSCQKRVLVLMSTKPIRCAYLPVQHDAGMIP